MSPIVAPLLRLIPSNPLLSPDLTLARRALSSAVALSLRLSALVIPRRCRWLRGFIHPVGSISVAKSATDHLALLQDVAAVRAGRAATYIARDGAANKKSGGSSP
jgi:hypothetical protein